MFVPKGQINNIYSIGLDNGLAPARRQAIIWTNDGWSTDAYVRHSALMNCVTWIHDNVAMAQQTHNVNT